MKKYIFIIILIIVSYFFLNFDNNIKIPDEAIRLRVIANSNSEYDLKIKEKVKKELQSNIVTMLSNVNDINEARIIINKNISMLDNKISKLLKKENYLLSHSLNYGLNYFPEKQFKGITYKEGYYESIKVTLGEALGDNWWCVLFPPLCLLEAEESDEIEYKFFIKEFIKKYF